MKSVAIVPGKTSPYTLKVGHDAMPRLKRLNDMCNPLSLQFIQQHIDLKNKKILDLGCGVGLLSSELAKRSLPNGSVWAVDQSQAQLDIAQAISKENKLHNMQFKKISALEIDSLETKFDLIYCRLLLAHLSPVPEVIQKITKLMHSNSILICEEPNSIYSLYCDPFDPVFERFRQAAIMHVELSQLDFSIGTQLNSIFLKNNLKPLQQKIVQAKLDTPELKQQLWQGILEVKPLLVEHNFLSPKEVDDLVIALKKFANTSKADVRYWHHTQIAAILEN